MKVSCMNMKKELFFAAAFISLAVLVILSLGCTKKAVTYEEKDVCGPVPGGYIYAIKDEDACRQHCFSDCLSLKMTLQKVDFVLAGDPPCNKCTCYCSD
ncbi:hypothetical protein COV21_03935 [Candidatus Woesearchaeota archaeon CG10_big_fil_rev_8_21_14_0_10_45_5]|nr:MAG: hypothetical protein COV21_03935 [Candidatus Woesearchaeota archaeon CG10_big_fil_rev_8_21_14_0_10_45_5]